jgi:hypothetical protein
MKFEEAKSTIKIFIFAFIATVLLLELLANTINQTREQRETSFELGYWNNRFWKETTAVELYGEDLWRNGHRTLKTPFNPSTCVAKHHQKWQARWVAIHCYAEDYHEKRWQYIVRHNYTPTPLFGIPFLVDAEPAKELKIDDNSAPIEEN